MNFVPKYLVNLKTEAFFLGMMQSPQERFMVFEKARPISRNAENTLLTNNEGGAVVVNSSFHVSPISVSQSAQHLHV